LSKNRNIKFGPFILLLLYAISVFPSFLFHHHANSKVAYDCATLCEKSIYYGDDSNHCGHKQHLTKNQKKCSLCDHFSIALFTFEVEEFKIFQQYFSTEFIGEYSSPLTNYTHLFYNKGPPNI